jgi:hypothetical protein
MNSLFSILAIVTILVIVANRKVIYHVFAAVFCTPLLAHACQSIVLQIDPSTVIPQWMLVAYIAGSILLVYVCTVWIAADRTPASLTHVRTRLRYGAQARRRVRQRIHFVTQENQP